ncbi:hypothetical protein [Neorhizobium sp. S3-V5DH]|uniref:hypothetical protein n=1 Tax=Neorhizobium sp. S3-V5DH TaxID=2485166 RepID=UPI001051C9E2|nr:hypothetical protein [Neorhizobium sp. S3-V5DH]TCV68630.1 hypothetical protein EDE09_11163 [Neorhizobium sp. S3-V5DH]
MLGPLLIFALLSTDLNSDCFSLSKDLLPFGVPSEFADGRSPVLTSKELLACFNRYAAVERQRLHLGVKRATLAVEESSGVINKQQREKSAPKDDLDRQLDEIERSVAEQNNLMKNTREFLLLRTKFFKEYFAFAEECGSKTYRSSDVRAIFPNGVPE